MFAKDTIAMAEAALTALAERRALWKGKPREDGGDTPGRLGPRKPRD